MLVSQKHTPKIYNDPEEEYVTVTIVSMVG